MDEPLDVGHIEWIDFRFKDIEDDELFWFEKKKLNNPSFRKIDDNTALHISEQRFIPVNSNPIVYQKEY
tara:strand:+ start:249 stop:455 length:207 start_codon:yes stop_codon:yes gene_type:complete